MIKFLNKGINTSDATATADDIISPKTAYVNGEKIEGNIELVGEEITEAQIIDKTFNTDLQADYIATTPDGYAICTRGGGNVEVVSLKTGDKKTYSQSELGITNGAGQIQAVAVCKTANEYGAYMVVFMTRSTHANATTHYFSCTYYKDGSLLYRASSDQAAYYKVNLKSDWGMGAVACSNTKANTFIGICSKSSMGEYSKVFTVALDLKSATTKQISLLDGNVSYRYSHITLSEDDRFAVMYHQESAISALLLLNDDLTFKKMNTVSSNYRSMLISKDNKNYVIENNNLYGLTYDESSGSYSKTLINSSVFPTTYREGTYTDDLILIHNSDKTYTLYSYVLDELEGMTLTELKTYFSEISFSKNYIKLTSCDKYIIQVGTNAIIRTFAIIDIGGKIPKIVGMGDFTLYNTDDATVTSDKLLLGEVAYSSTGKIIGTMVIDASVDSNILAENIKEGVTILGVTGTYTG